MLTKYQILGGSLSVATTAVGIYQGVKVLGTNKKPSAPQTEVLTNLPEATPSRDQAIIDVPEEEQPLQTPAPAAAPKEPKSDANSKPAEPPSKPNNAAPKENTVSDDPESQKKQNKDSPTDKPSTTVDSEEYGLFGDSDAGGIGWKFKDFLNGSTKSDAWQGKLNHWNRNLNNSALKSTMHSAFQLSNKNSSSIEALQTRCQNAYKKKTWTEHLSAEDGQALKYWAAVATYCSRPNTYDPDDWYKG